MTIRDRVRAWLGLDAIDRLHARQSQSESIIGERLDRFELSMTALRDSEERHYRDLMDTSGAEDRHGEIIELLTKLEQHFVSQHVGTRPASMPVLDWEQVQIQELAEMLANPPQEVV